MFSGSLNIAWEAALKDVDASEKASRMVRILFIRQIIWVILRNTFQQTYKKERIIARL